MYGTVAYFGVVLLAAVCIKRFKGRINTHVLVISVCGLLQQIVCGTFAAKPPDMPVIIYNGLFPVLAIRRCSNPVRHAGDPVAIGIVGVSHGNDICIAHGIEVTKTGISWR